MIYKIGVYNYLKNEVVFQYKFLKNPNSMKYSRKHIVISNETLSGWLNFEWGLEQRKISLTVSMPFRNGYRANPYQDARYFEEKLSYVVDSRYERWFFGRKDELFVGFVTDWSYDRKADNPNSVGFNINFLVDEYNKDYSVWVKKVSDKMFKVADLPLSIKGYKNYIMGKIKEQLYG